MFPIITQPGMPAHVHPDEAARQRRDRLARATAGQAEAALAYLSAIDPLPLVALASPAPGPRTLASLQRPPRPRRRMNHAGWKEMTVRNHTL